QAPAWVTKADSLRFRRSAREICKDGPPADFVGRLSQSRLPRASDSGPVLTSLGDASKMGPPDGHPIPDLDGPMPDRPRVPRCAPSRRGPARRRARLLIRTRRGPGPRPAAPVGGSDALQEQTLMPAGRGTVSLGPGEWIVREAEVAQQGPEV